MLTKPLWESRHRLEFPNALLKALTLGVLCVQGQSDKTFKNS